MIEDEVRQVVTNHYNDGDAELLLLSALGFVLRQDGKWPVPGEKRSLLEVIEATSGLEVIRDDDAESYIAVVLTGDEKRAVAKIADRRKRYFLNALPKALLLAFTLDMAEGQVMTVRLGQKLTYQGGSVAEEGTILVDQDLRLPGANIGNLKSWTAEAIERLDTNIRSWAQRHKLELDDLRKPNTHEKQAQGFSTSGSSTHGSALDRLYAAQDPEVAKRLIMPIDIALALSRMP